MCAEVTEEANHKKPPLSKVAAEAGSGDVGGGDVGGSGFLHMTFLLRTK